MSLKTKTILFFPSETGLAHITTSLAIAEKLKRQGYKIIFAMSSEKQGLVEEKGTTVIPIKRFIKDEDMLNFEKVVFKASYLEPLIKEEIEVLKKSKPDLVIINCRISAIISCAVLDIPTIFITNSALLPCKTYLPNTGLPKILFKVLSPFIRRYILTRKWEYFDLMGKAITEAGFNYTLKELLKRLVYIVPELPEYFPANNNLGKTYYIGPLLWNGFDQYQPDWIKSLKPNGKTVYLTFGGTGYDGQKLINLSKLLLEKSYTVVVSASDIVEVNSFPKHERLLVAKYLPGEEICRRVDAIICHGGYGTMIQALMAGIPVVAVPFNPDQLLNSFRIQELGLGKCVTQLNLVGVLRFSFTSLQKAANAIPPEFIVENLEEVLRNREKYQKRLKIFQNKLVNIKSADKAVEIINKLLEVAC